MAVYIYFQTLMLLATAGRGTAAFSITSIRNCNKCSAVQHRCAATATGSEYATAEQNQKDRPLLRQFGRGITERILESKEGYNQFGLTNDHYTSAEMIPCLDMQCNGGEVTSSGGDGRGDDRNNASRRTIRRAYTESSNKNPEGDCEAEEEAGGRGISSGIHGRSSGSGCSVIRLRGQDAVSIRGLVNFADDFFEGVDDDNCNKPINEVGVFRIANNVHCGFDTNVNSEGKMQVLYTKMIPGETKIDDPTLLPMEVGDLVGAQSLGHAHRGMNTLFDIGSQITSAVLGMDSLSTTKLLDDCSSTPSDDDDDASHSTLEAENVSNSYQRLIRYLKPQQEAKVDGEIDAAFWPHVDSTFLTLIPMPELPGLEVWCPSKKDAESCDLSQRGEWVRPIEPINDRTSEGDEAGDDDEDYAYVIALAGEFLQLLSDGQVPTCIHRVIPPQHRPLSPAMYGFGPKEKYKPRISAPLFVRPRRKDDAILDVSSDLKNFESGPDSSTNMPSDRGLYFEEGLMEECDDMNIWEYMDCMSPNN